MNYSRFFQFAIVFILYLSIEFVDFSMLKNKILKYVRWFH